MPLKDEHKVLRIPVTQAQYAIIKKTAKDTGVKMSVLGRKALAAYIGHFPDDMPELGSGLNKEKPQAGQDDA